MMKIAEASVGFIVKGVHIVEKLLFEFDVVFDKTRGSKIFVATLTTIRDMTTRRKATEASGRTEHYGEICVVASIESHSQ